MADCNTWDRDRRWSKFGVASDMLAKDRLPLGSNEPTERVALDHLHPIRRLTNQMNIQVNGSATAWTRCQGSLPSDPEIDQRDDDRVDKHETDPTPSLSMDP